MEETRFKQLFENSTKLYCVKIWAVSSREALRIGSQALQNRCKEAVTRVNAGNSPQKITSDSALQMFVSGLGRNAILSQSIEHPSDWNEADPGRLVEHFFHNGLILLRLQRTGGVNEAAARGQTGQPDFQDRYLPRLLAVEVGFVDPKADLRIAGHGAGAAARHVTEDELVFGIEAQRGGIGDPKVEPVAGMGGEQPSGEFETLTAYIDGSDLGVRQPLSKNGGLSTGSSTGIECSPRARSGTTGDLSDQLGGFVLDADLAALKCHAQISAHDEPGPLEERAWLCLDLLGEGLIRGKPQSHACRFLIPAADRRGSFEAELPCPSLDQPRRMRPGCRYLLRRLRLFLQFFSTLSPNP